MLLRTQCPSWKRAFFATCQHFLTRYTMQRVTFERRYGSGQSRLQSSMSSLSRATRLSSPSALETHRQHKLALQQKKELPKDVALKVQVLLVFVIGPLYHLPNALHFRADPSCDCRNRLHDCPNPPSPNGLVLELIYEPERNYK